MLFSDLAVLYLALNIILSKGPLCKRVDYVVYDIVNWILLLSVSISLVNLKNRMYC
jgi:hypothetical protein